MRVSLDWLAEWIDLPNSQDELAARLTVAGLEIEDIERAGPALEGIWVGHVLEHGPHPNADRLSFCRVDLGSGEPLEIVCGAPNVAAGQKVAVAPPGTTLPDGTVLKKAKIRGVASHGMICSESELGLGDGHEGILVLPPDAPVGAPLAEVLRGGDTVLDLEITPNRGDWASMLGVAREVRAHYGGELRLPLCAPVESSSPAAEHVVISVDDAGGCHRYLGRVVTGVQLQPSPDWLQSKLEAAGLRAINVVVDVTNLVLLEFGQPLHAFDLAAIRGREISVRSARSDEKIATLDGEMRELDVGDLVIADAERAVAVAGVMGGAETEVRDDTHDILIECAHFDPTRVRKTARRLGLNTDASYRFERGVDPNGLQRAVDRAARLIAELAGGQVAAGTVEAVGAPFVHTDRVDLDLALPNRLLGTELSTPEVIELLGRVDIEASERGAALSCVIPSYRNDIRIPEDLVEEVARVFGYDRIPETMPVAPMLSVLAPPRYELEYRVRDSLCAAGSIEIRTFAGTPGNDADLLRLAPDDPRRKTLRILNPHHEDASHLRTTLIPSLLRAARLNLSHQSEALRLFEVGCHFRPRAAGELPDEPLCVAALATQAERTLWGEAPPIFFELKGTLERLCADLGYALEARAGGDEPYLHPGAAAELVVAGQRLGVLGELHPEVAAAFEIDVPCAVFELELEGLISAPPPKRRYSEISRQPLVRRDVAVLLESAQPSGEIADAICKTGGDLVVSVELFDRYDGKGIPAGKVSLAFRVVLQRADRALKDTEITRIMDRIRKMLVKRFGGELR
jgi:phenylalanyl-tRNA synthetase beta chain